MNVLRELSLETLRRAAEIREQIAQLERELDELEGGYTPRPAAPAPWSGKRRLSPEGLANIRAGVRKRMAMRAKMESAGAPAANGRKKRRKLSPQALANIRAGVRKRMAARARANA